MERKAAVAAREHNFIGETPASRRLWSNASWKGMDSVWMGSAQFRHPGDLRSERQALDSSVRWNDGHQGSGQSTQHQQHVDELDAEKRHHDAAQAVNQPVAAQQ